MIRKLIRFEELRAAMLEQARACLEYPAPETRPGIWALEELAVRLRLGDLSHEIRKLAQDDLFFSPGEAD